MGVNSYMYITITLILFQLPVITDLRNPSLKQRHWKLIEEIIDHKFNPEVPITLQLLTELKVFDKAEAIQEVSGQASSEASLEAILKKVCSRTINCLSLQIAIYSAHVCACTYMCTSTCICS